MHRPFSLFVTVVFSIFIAFYSSFAMAAENEALANAQRALDAAIDDAAIRNENANGQRFAFTTQVETGDKDNPLIEFSFDPEKPYEDRVTIIHPTLEENPKALEKILKQKKKTLEKRKKEGTQATQDRDLIVDLSREFIAAVAPRFVRETKSEYIFAFKPTRVSMNMGKDEKNDARDAGENSKKDTDDNFSRHLKGEIAVGKDEKQFMWMRLFSTEAFKPAAVAKIKNFEMFSTFAPAWPDGPLVKVRQEIKVSGKAIFRKFDQHSVIESFAFEKR